ncbi:MAG: CHAT domain-containing protein [Acidobacteriota bacterium]
MHGRTLSAFLVLAWCVSLAGVKRLAEWGAEHPKRRGLVVALESSASLAPLVEESPDVARALVEELWLEGLKRRAVEARLEGSRGSFERAERLSRAIADRWGESSFLEATAFYRRLGPGQAARQMRAMKLASGAETEVRQGSGSEAREVVLGALEICRDLGDVWGELHALHVLGNAHMIAGEDEEAERIYTELLERAREYRNPEREAAAANNLAALQAARGKFREAAAGYRRVLELSELHGLPRIKAFALLYLGNLYHHLGIPERSTSLLRDAEESFRALGETRLEAMAASNRGAGLHRMGRRGEALETYRRALSLRSRQGDRAGRIGTLLNIAELLQESGNPGQALDVLGQILALTRRTQEAAPRRIRWGAWLIAGDVHLARGDLEAARKSFARAEALASEVGNALDGAETARRQASLCLAEGRIPEAVAHLEEAVHIIEALRVGSDAAEERIRFLEAQESVYKELAGVHLRELDNPEAAFDLLERARARTFLDSLQGGALVSVGEAGRLRVLLPSSAEPEGWQAVASHLLRGAVVLHYTVAPEWLGILAVDTDGVRAWHVGEVGAAELSGLTRALERPGSGWTKGSFEPIQTLSHLLLEPIEELLAQYRTLVVVPDGVLFKVPWAALRWRGHYLVQSHEVIVEPSASVFVRLTRKERSPLRSALVVVNPLAREPAVASRESDRDPSARPLPGAEAEGVEVASFLPRARVLLGAQATEQAVRSEIGRHSIIHFGTHARVEAEDPLASPLLLAGGAAALEDVRLAPVSPSDGVLTGYEVLELELRSGALVTLAACETVRGGRRGGEGVVGLARAFLEAGAGSVVASLWPVEDQATRELMVRLYRGLSRHHRATAAALSVAQRALADGDAGQRLRHPYYWAGFILLGNGG